MKYPSNRYGLIILFLRRSGRSDRPSLRWSMRDSNPRPLRCERNALPAAPMPLSLRTVCPAGIQPASPPPMTASFKGRLTPFSPPPLSGHPLFPNASSVSVRTSPERGQPPEGRGTGLRTNTDERSRTAGTDCSRSPKRSAVRVPP